MKFRLALAALNLLIAFGAFAATTNGLSEAEIKGRELAQQLVEQHPVQNSKNTGVLKIRDGSSKTDEIPIGFRITVTATNWQCVYNIHKIFGSKEDHPGWTSLVVTHNGTNPSQYQFYKVSFESESYSIKTNLVGEQTMIPFAGSDFWIADLGLEFFHWPEQKILKSEMRRGRSCQVLESTNPNPSPNGYSHVVSWIDNETLGIVHAEAYDAKGKLLKGFDPKSFKKVNGQWELQEMEIRNVQTGSRTRLEFDVKKE